MKKRILVIDDSASMRHVVLQTLASGGYEAVGSASPEEALVLLHAEKFQLVLCDFNMPGMNGLQLIRQIKASDAPNRFTPFLVMTTERDEEKKADGRAAGASAWLVKPFEMPTLLAAVAKLCA